jgi:two-component system, chemotaxis family, protein-glutamate methylesterase/glutaminase
VPLPPVRVLVVDDSVVVRRLVSDVLTRQDGIEVVGTAPNGRIALQKIPQLSPDLITLDVEMPEMDGIETLKAIRVAHRDLPVIMFSTLTERGAAVTIDALMHGANDYVTKPANVGSVEESMARVAADLTPRIHALCGSSRGADAAARAPRSPIASTALDGSATPAVGPVGPPARVDLVVIGVSTGGPNALAALVPALPADLPVPVLIVQHMPAMFTRLLAERLDSASAVAVREAAGGERIGPGQCWIAPGDHHLEVTGTSDALSLRIHDGEKENSCRPAVDVLFRSAVAATGRHTLGVVMTGMGRDGQRGATDLVRAGARVVVQDEASSVVWGMPGAVVEAGSADGVLPLDRLASEIASRVAVGRAALTGSVAR